MYKKGYISNVEVLSEHKALEMIFRRSSYDEKKVFFNNKITKEERKIISDYLCGRSRDLFFEYDVVYNNLYEILNKILINKDIGFNNQLEIIYEEIVGEDGIIYGKELLTGLIFPIMNSNNTKFNYTLKSLNNKKCVLFNYIFNISSMSRLSNLIINTGVANTIEIDNYKKLYRNNILNLNYRRFKKDINYLYKLNVYNYEIIEKEKVVEEKKKINLSNENIIMENIEYLLTLLEPINKDKYNLYLKEYNELLSNNSDLKLNHLDIISLGSLEAKIEIELRFSKRNANNIFDYIDKYKIEYLNNILIDGKNNEINLNDLDNFIELFIKVKDNYSLVDQRNIIKGIAFLYLMELYEDIDDITIDDLNNTHIDIIIKSIILNLKALIDLNVFKNNMNMELSDNITVNELYNIIKSIKIDDKKRVKKLIK